MTTLHGRQDLPDLKHLYAGFPDMPLVSISDAQREPIAECQFCRHGVPRPADRSAHADLPCARRLPRISRSHLAGKARRLAPSRSRALSAFRSRSPPRSIALTRSTSRPTIEPLLSLPGIEYIGEIDERRKNKFLGDARALLFPIDWPEPFGLVMIEAMACGTPVLAFRNGSVPEVIDSGVTGEVVDSVDEAICKIGSVLALDRGRVRRRFEQRFSAARMALDYVKIYEKLIHSIAPHAEERPLPAIVDDPGEAHALSRLQAPKVGVAIQPSRRNSPYRL